MRALFGLNGTVVALASVLLVSCTSAPESASTSVDDTPLGGEASVSVYSYGPPDDRLALVAGYQRAPGRDVCTEETMGDCVVRDCSQDELTGLGIRAGRVTVTVGDREVTIDSAPDSTYGPPSSVSPMLFHGGETVSFQVAGSDDVPAHSASVVAPSPINMTAPDLSTSSLTIDRSHDLAFAWSGGQAGELLFATGSERGDGSKVSITCRFPASAGSASIPAATLARLAPSTGTPSALVFWVMSRTEIDFSGWHAAFSALSQVLDANGDAVSMTATIQ